MLFWVGQGPILRGRRDGRGGKPYLLELKLGAPSDIGIGIKCCDDAASNSFGIHLGRTQVRVADVVK